MSCMINFARTRPNGSAQIEARLLSNESCESARQQLDALMDDDRLQPGDLLNPAALATRCASWSNMEIRIEPRKDVDCTYWVLCDGGRPNVITLRGEKRC